MTIPTTQLALQVDHLSAPFVLRSVSVRNPGPGEVLIRVEAAGMNPADWIYQKTPGVIKSFPAVLGLEFAGKVVGVGEGVVENQGLRVGDRVLTESRFLDHEYMAYQQYALADAVTVSKIPDSVSYEQAASLPVAIATVVSGLFSEFPHGTDLPSSLLFEAEKAKADSDGERRNKPLVVLAGASSVGQAAIQIARIVGFDPIIATASLKNAKYLESLGATHVLDRYLDPQTLSKAIKEITNTIGGRAPVDLVFGAMTFPDTENQALAILPSDGTGTLISTNPNPSKIVLSADVKVVRAMCSTTVPWNKELLAKVFLEKVKEWLEKGDIKPNNIEVLPGGLAGVAGGVERLEKMSVSCLKLVVRPQDTPPLSRSPL